MTSSNRSYKATLAELAPSLPRLAAALNRAERHRAQRAASLLHGARLKGTDQLLHWFDELISEFADDGAVSRFAFLVDRCRADLETAVEATLSGYVGVAARRDA